MHIAEDCPFCGEYIGPVVARQGTKYTFYQVMHQPNKKGRRHGLIIMDVDEWNTRPIEDALNARIAELEGKIDQLTAHDATERQDDKLPEREVCEACGGDGSILLRDNYKGQATATVDCPYCNCTGYVKESENDRVAS